MEFVLVVTLGFLVYKGRKSGKLQKPFESKRERRRKAAVVAAFCEMTFNHFGQGTITLNDDL